MWMPLTVFVLEDVENGEELPVVGEEGLTNVLAGLDQELEGLQGPTHDARVPGVQGGCAEEEEEEEEEEVY